MKLNEAGINLIKLFEGLKLTPYLDSAGVPTIGYGSTYYFDGTKVTIQDKPLTQAQADALFASIVDRFAISVADLVTTNLNDNQFSALVSFAYNLGVFSLGQSTLLSLVNANPNNPQITTEFNKWIYAGGNMLNGLVRRRAAEAKLYFS